MDPLSHQKSWLITFRILPQDSLNSIDYTQHSIKTLLAPSHILQGFRSVTVFGKLFLPSSPHPEYADKTGSISDIVVAAR